MGYHDNDGILEGSLCVRKGYARAKKHGFRLAEISRVQGSGKRVMLKALVAVIVTDAPFSRLFEVVIIRYDKVARDRGIVHMINTRARTSLDRT